MSKTITGCIRELSDLTEAARHLVTKAKRLNMRGTASHVRGIAYNLDAARTRLVEDADYLPTAQAFVTAASVVLPSHAALIARSAHRAGART